MVPKLFFKDSYEALSLKNYALSKIICGRSLENRICHAASIVGKTRTVDLVVRVREAILQSEYPGAVCYMRNVDALRQQYRRLINIFLSIITIFCSL
jgi:hypothetical protein